MIFVVTWWVTTLKTRIWIYNFTSPWKPQTSHGDMTLTDWLINYLHGARDVPEKLTVTQLLKKFHDFSGTRRFITVFTGVCHRSLPWVRCIQSTPSHPVSLRYILILPSCLHLGLPSGLFPSGFSTKMLCPTGRNNFLTEKRDEFGLLCNTPKADGHCAYKMAVKFRLQWLLYRAARIRVPELPGYLSWTISSQLNFWY